MLNVLLPTFLNYHKDLWFVLAAAKGVRHVQILLTVKIVIQITFSNYILLTILIYVSKIVQQEESSLTITAILWPTSLLKIILLIQRTKTRPIKANLLMKVLQFLLSPLHLRYWLLFLALFCFCYLSLSLVDLNW